MRLVSPLQSCRYDQRPIRSRKQGGLDARTKLLIGFGHLNAYDSQVVLRAVYDVVAEPVDASRYDQATLVGTVMDGSGAVIPIATATLHRPGRKGIVAQAKTEASGVFKFSRLREDIYELGIEAPGFMPQMLKRIVVGWASDVQLKPVKLNKLRIVLDDPPGEFLESGVSSTTQRRRHSEPVLFLTGAGTGTGWPAQIVTPRRLRCACRRAGLP